MDGRIIVSGGGGLRVFSLPDGKLLRRAPLAGAGALCCGGGRVFCACGRKGAVLALDDNALEPQALYAAGPGICALRMRGERLYALCGEGDGVLSLDTQNGCPQFFARAGLSPLQMAEDEGGALVVAGGEGSCVTRLDGETLEMLGCDAMPGPVYGAAAFGGCRYALCLTETLDSLLVAAAKDGARRVLRLPGLPGALAFDRAAGVLLAAVQGGVYAVKPDGGGLCGFCPVPGCVCGAGSRLMCFGGRAFLIDAATERLWMISGGRASLVCGDAADAAPLDT